MMMKLNLLNIDGIDLPWRPFTENGRKNVKSYQIFHDIESLKDGAKCSLLKYLPGSVTLPHIHTGFELIYMISGCLYDDYDRYVKGDLVVFSPNSVHGLRSPDGCIFLVLWDKPVQLIDGR